MRAIPDSVLIVVRVPRRLRERGRDAARARGISFSELVRRALSGKLPHDAVATRPHRSPAAARSQPDTTSGSSFESVDPGAS